MEFRKLFLRVARIGTVAAAVLIPATAQAEWSLQKGPDWVVTQARDGAMLIDIRCSRAFAGRLTVTVTGPKVQDVPGVMLWITLPDGRLARQPIDVSFDGTGLGGTLTATSIVMDQFRQGTQLEIDMPTRGGEDLAVVDMTGTGAARIAMQERCGL